MTEQQPRMVKCVKIGKELPGLSAPPRNDELGQRIYENVSAQAWQLWLDQQTILINHYGLNMADPAAHEFLSQQMEEFFFGDDSQLPDDWIPPDQGPSGPAPVKGGKGAPAPRGKNYGKNPQKVNAVTGKDRTSHVLWVCNPTWRPDGQPDGHVGV